MTQPPPADPSPPVPANAEQALAIGRTQFPDAWPDGTQPTLRVEEFDIGYLVYTVSSPSTDPTAPPPAPGGSNIVISKVNGEITDVPNYPAEEAIATYRRFYRPTMPRPPA